MEHPIPRTRVPPVPGKFEDKQTYRTLLFDSEDEGLTRVDLCNKCWNAEDRSLQTAGRFPVSLAGHLRSPTSPEPDAIQKDTAETFSANSST